jgi:hypothetical protein
MVDLLTRVACFVKKLLIFALSKAAYFKLISTRRSIVRILPRLVRIPCLKYSTIVEMTESDNTHAHCSTKLITAVKSYKVQASRVPSFIPIVFIGSVLGLMISFRENLKRCGL